MSSQFPCPKCESKNCGLCVADKLEAQGHLRDAKFHCSCARKGHIKNKMRSKM